MRETDVTKIIAQIKNIIISENFKVEILYRKFRHKERDLLEKIIEAKMRKDEIRALMYAQELATVREILRRISKIQLIFERTLIRLETIEIFGDYKSKIVPLNDLISNLKLEVQGVLPKLSYKLNRIEKHIHKLLADMTV